MRTVSSYGVEIRKQNIPACQTMEIYRQAVGYLTEIYAQVWEELRKIPETKKRFKEDNEKHLPCISCCFTKRGKTRRTGCFC